MPLKKTWAERWRRFLDFPGNDTPNAVEFLRRRYVEEVQRTERFKQHAEQMHYPQYREKFLRMANEKSQHAERIGAKIAALGGQLPDVANRRATDENSWRSLAMALDDEDRSADRLPQQLRSIESEHPEIVKFLQQIAREQESHRGEIRDMLMRSDPFAFSLA